MTDTLTHKLIAETEQAFAMRDRNWLHQWQELAEHLAPNYGDFETRNTPGERKDERLVDSYGVWAAKQFATRVNGNLTGEGQDWLNLRILDDRVARLRHVQVWKEHVSRVLLRAITAPSSNFDVSAEEKYLQLAVFGSAPVFIGDRNGMPFFRTEFLGRTAIWTDEDGRMIAVFRRYKNSAYNLERQFGVAALPQRVQEVLRDDPTREFTCIHATRPRGQDDPKSILAGHKYLSAYIVEDVGEIIGRPKGFYENPWIFPRWAKAPNEMYGRGPGVDALPDVRMMQKVQKDTIRLIHKIVDPNVLVDDDGTLQPRLNHRPGAPWYGRKDINGNWNVQVVPYQGDPAGAEWLLNRLQDRIKRHFHLDAFELPPSVTDDGSVNHMSATEFAGRRREQMEAIGPMLSRQRVEDLMPMVQRVYGIMARAGRLPPVPQEVQEVGILPEYVSPLAIAQRAHEANTVMTLLGQITAWANVDPRVLDAVHPERTVDLLAESGHVPPSILTTAEERQAKAEQRAQQAQMAERMEQMRTGSEAAEHSAKALSHLRSA